MNKLLVLPALLLPLVAMAETAPPAAAPAPRAIAPAAAPAAPRAAAPANAPAAPRTSPAAAVPSATPGGPGQGLPAAPEAQPVAPVTPPPPTAEQRRQMELLSSAERIDKANRELLARNQELQLQNENLAMQINIIRHDKSSEGIWKGAIAVIAGFLLGWFFANSNRRKSSW